MIESSASGLLVIGAALLLFRPKDVPLLGRVAGRICGVTVRTMRKVKDGAEETWSEANSFVNQNNNPDITAVREGLQKSMSKFDFLRSTVRSDMPRVPTNAASFLRQGLQRLEQDIGANKRADGEITTLTSARTAPLSGTKSGRVLNGSSSTASGYSPIRNSVSGQLRGGRLTGADVLSRSIEEAALVDQQKRVLLHSTKD